MRWLLLFGAFASFSLIVQGILWLVKFARRKVIASGPLISGALPLGLVRAGRYSIFIHGGGSIGRPLGIPMEVSGAGSSGAASLTPPSMPFRRRSPGGRSFEYARFQVMSDGLRSLVVGSLTDVVVFPSQLSITRFLQSPVPLDKLRISVEEGVHTVRFILSILFLVVGANAMCWCLLLFFRPDLINS